MSVALLEMKPRRVRNTFSRSSFQELKNVFSEFPGLNIRFPVVLRELVSFQSKHEGCPGASRTVLMAAAVLVLLVCGSDVAHSAWRGPAGVSAADAPHVSGMSHGEG